LRPNTRNLLGTESFSALRFSQRSRTSTKGFNVKKLAAVLVMASAMTLAPMPLAPAVHADVCAAAGGRHVAVGGCTNVAGDAAAVAIAAQDNPYVPDEVPCYTVQGTPYYTPPGDPC
jgi:hypothetical protein